MVLTQVYRNSSKNKGPKRNRSAISFYLNYLIKLGFLPIYLIKSEVYSKLLLIIK